MTKTKIFDLDRHVLEPSEMWLEYLPSDFQQYAPTWIHLSSPKESLGDRLKRLGDFALLSNPSILAVQGKPIWAGLNEIALIEMSFAAKQRLEVLSEASTAKGQLADMDKTGVSKGVLLPSHAAYLVYDDETSPVLSRTYAEAYNRWMSDICRVDPQRLIGAALISRHDPDKMVDDLRAAQNMGLTSVVLRPNPVLGRTLGDRVYEKFWSACEEAALPIFLHEGTHGRVPTLGTDRFNSTFGKHACSHALEAMVGFLSLLEGGVFEHHPKLKIALLEAGSGWVSYWLWRLDNLAFPRLRREMRGRVNERPSEYFSRQCWVAIEPEEPLLAEQLPTYGHCFVFGSDYPHLDHSLTLAQDVASTCKDLKEKESKAILWDNAIRLFDSSHSFYE